MLPRVVNSKLIRRVGPRHPTKIEHGWVELPEILINEAISKKAKKQKSQPHSLGSTE